MRSKDKRLITISYCRMRDLRLVFTREQNNGGSLDQIAQQARKNSGSIGEFLKKLEFERSYHGKEMAQENAKPWLFLSNNTIEQLRENSSGCL
ncbi:hypothetical protein NC653_022216 [Populus alba x Populus x berolinensis]|uniref:Uncharacterized protein n=1 Tax=Populus alba x Populus x berolinensis TaxID=444605 RepID=A0AAD6ME73_9ROSI|nr:hypothetical protein NC653_022216 [Populus alba x Populus x berolinensis]